VVAAVLMAVRWWRGPQVPTDTVVRRDFVQTVVASGRVEAPHRVDIGTQIIGTVVRVPVSEGQMVAAGELLVELDSAELTAARRQADGEVLRAQAQLRQLQEVQAPMAAQTLRQAQSNLDTVRAALRRNQQLFDQGFIGQAALDEAVKTADVADAQRRTTQAQLDTTRRSGSDYAVLQAALASAEANAQAALARAQHTSIKAPLSGTLIGRNVEVGDVVQAGKVLMTLSPTGRTQLVVAIDEKNLALLALGQRAIASADAYPAQRLAVVLAYINPGVNALTGAVEVKLDVPAPPPSWKQDMTVSVDIEVARRTLALLVPVDAVHDPAAVSASGSGSGSAAGPAAAGTGAATAAPADASTAAQSPTTWVLRLEGQHAVRRSVRLGLRSGGLAEVLDGLSEGDVVVSAAAATLDGDRARSATAALPAAASATRLPTAPASAASPPVTITQ
jgi:HlyD family secretion protein